MNRFLALLLALWPSFASAQGLLNQPIYATGYVPVAAGTTVTTNIVNSRPTQPSNLNILAQGAITTWNVVFPTNPFDGQIITLVCAGGAVTTINPSSAYSTVQSGAPSSCAIGQWIQYQFTYLINTWTYIGSSVASISIANLAPITPGLLGFAGTGTGAVTSLTTLPSGLTIPAAASISTSGVLTLSANAVAVPTPVIPTAQMNIANSDGAATSMSLTAFGNGANATSNILLSSTRGTGASPSASLSGDNLGQFQWRGYGATSYAATKRASINGVAAENWTDTAQGTYFSFYTTPTGTTSTAEQMRLSAAGYLGIGTTGPAQRLDVAGAIAISGTTAIDASRNGVFASLTDNAFSTAGIVTNTSAGALNTSTMTAYLDATFGSTQGSILTRTSSGWTILPPAATAGWVLASGGTGANIGYMAAGGTGTVTEQKNVAGTGLTQSGNCDNTTTNASSPCTFNVSQTYYTNSLGANVTMTSAATFYDGPSTAQGTSGTWLATGGVTINDTSNITQYTCKLWDGTTVIDAGPPAQAASYTAHIHLSGVLASPGGNIKITCSSSATGAVMLYNQTGTSKDSTLTVVRIQ